MSQKNVIDKVTKILKRYGYSDFENDGSFNSSIEEIVDCDFEFDELPTECCWVWTGSTFIKNNLLETAQRKKIDEIDTKTRAIIAQGFEWNYNIFSLSMEAQRNLAALLDIVRDGTLASMGAFEGQGYPYVTKNDDILYFTDNNVMLDFLTTGLGYVTAVLHSAYPFKAQVKACSTVEEVEAVEDTR